MIVDNFLFSNEFDMLELRLNIIGNSVDRIVIAESDYTFTNLYKGYLLESKLSEYGEYKDKIIYIKLKSPKFSNPWENEFYQRDCFSFAWRDLKNSDVLMISDIDEIPRPEALEFIRNTDYNYYGLLCPIFYFKFNYLNVHSEYSVWNVAVRNSLDVKPSFIRRTGNEIQREKPKKSVLIHHAGYHFSWLGDDDFVKNKLKSFSHTEYNTPEVINNVNTDLLIKSKQDHMRLSSWETVNLDSYYPSQILKNLEKYNDYISYYCSSFSVLDYYPYEILSTIELN